ncbi:MAG: matrixin family metalloprotease [Pseudohongiellaceae bacterium]
MQNKEHLKIIALTAMTSVSLTATAIEPVFIDHGIYNPDKGEYYDKSSEFVGFSPSFGRFPDGIVKIAYNHAGAPANTTVEETDAVLRKSFAIIEGIADIKFQYSGVSADPVADAANNIVVVDWFTEDSTTLAVAGPAVSQDPALLEQLGYAPFVTGGFSYNGFHGDPIVSTSVHELMHLLGLAHSDDPVSIMRPELSRWDQPTKDDIDALQAMYGPPDVLSLPNNPINLENTAASDSFAVDIANTNLLLTNNPEGGGFEEAPIERLTAEAPSTSFLTLGLKHSGTTADSALAIYLTDPNGHTSVSNTEMLDLNSTTSFLFIETTPNLATIAGNWTITVGNAGRQIGVFTLAVDSIPNSDNKNPVAALSKTDIGNNQFTLAVTASDAEGDAISYRWNIPGQGELVDAASSLNVTAQSSGPIQAFVGVQDAGIKRTKEGPETTGFGALFSRYIVMPAAENTATYFPTQKLLHLPTLDAGGLVVSANFKLTSLPGVVFKLVEFDVISGFSGTASATADLGTGILNMPSIIVSDNGVTQTIPNVTLKLDPSSQPIKFGL